MYKCEIPFKCHMRLTLDDNLFHMSVLVLYVVSQSVSAVRDLLLSNLNLSLLQSVTAVTTTWLRTGAESTWKTWSMTPHCETIYKTYSLHTCWQTHTFHSLYLYHPLQVGRSHSSLQSSSRWDRWNQGACLCFELTQPNHSVCETWASFTNMCEEMFLLSTEIKCVRKITAGFMTRAHQPILFSPPCVCLWIRIILNRQVRVRSL